MGVGRHRASFSEKVIFELHLKRKVGASRQKRSKLLSQVKGNDVKSIRVGKDILDKGDQEWEQKAVVGPCVLCEM